MSCVTVYHFIALINEAKLMFRVLEYKFKPKYSSIPFYNRKLRLSHESTGGKAANSCEIF